MVFQINPNMRALKTTEWTVAGVTNFCEPRVMTSRRRSLPRHIVGVTGTQGGFFQKEEALRSLILWRACPAHPSALAASWGSQWQITPLD